jgi:hypothetical protein
MERGEGAVEAMAAAASGVLAGRHDDLLQRS